MSYVDFDYYINKYGGSLSDVEFYTLESKATLLVAQFMELYIAPWNLKESIEDYPCDMKEAICYQIDCLNSFGGLDSINLSSPSDFDIKTIKTEGFEYSYDSDVLKQRIRYFNGIPFSQMSIGLIKKQLRLHGLMCRKV